MIAISLKTSGKFNYNLHTKKCAFSLFCDILHNLTARKHRDFVRGFGAFQDLKMHESGQFFEKIYWYHCGIISDCKWASYDSFKDIKSADFLGEKGAKVYTSKPTVRLRQTQAEKAQKVKQNQKIYSLWDVFKNDNFLVYYFTIK